MRYAVSAFFAATAAPELYVLWCVAAAVESGAPFPHGAAVLGRLIVISYASAAVIAISVRLARRAWQRSRSRRLGILRMDVDGRFYYTKTKK